MDRVGIWVRYIVIGGVLVTFVFFFGPQSRMGAGGGTHAPNAVATVNGEDIPREIFEYVREMNEETFRQYSQQGVDPERLRKMLDEQTRRSLIQMYLMAQEAESLGLSISDAALIADFQSAPIFQTDGKFDRERAERYLNRTGLGQPGYKALHRRQLLNRDFSRYVASPLRVSDAEVRDEIIRSETKLTLRVAAAGKAAFKQHVSVTPEDVKALLEKEPERVKGAYQMHISDYTREEQIHARHMLFTGEDAEAQALKARARLEAGEAFAAVAKDVSADEATRAEGGDLGTFPRGRMMPAFDQAAFALEVGKPSGPVKTDRGVHLILVESHDAASQTPFEQVQDKLAHDLLLEDRAADAARTAANHVLEKALAGEPLAKAAESEKLPVIVTPPFGFRDPTVPSLSGVTDVREAAFALTTDHPVPNRVFSDAESFYVVALQTRDVPSEEQIAGEMSATREHLLESERALTTTLWFVERTKQLEAAGKLKQYDVEAMR
jgi:peptidyl-prolyl cis-trans isomerase D